MDLGWDVAVPDFHSAIFQPGPVDHDADLAEHLNDAGLLADLSYAERLMEKANGTGYGSGMFACIRILA